MSPVDLENLRQPGPNDLVPAGHKCPRCDYPLEGLARGGVCPECGTPIKVTSQRPASARDNLTDAPVDYLVRMHTAFIGLAALGLLNSFLQAGMSVGGGLSSAVLVGLAILMAAAGAGWAGIVFGATISRPFMPGMQINPSRELVGYRRAARISQWAWLVQGGMLLGVVNNFNTPAADWYGWGARGAQLIGVVGFAPLCVWLAHIAEWGQHTSLGRRLRIAAGLLAVCGSLWTLAYWVSAFLSPGFFKGILGLIGIFSFMGYACGLGLFLVSQLQLAKMSRWAIVNARHAAGRDERVLERKARRAFSGEADADTPLGELSARRGDEALDPCAGCGYDMTGLPPASRCPECGRAPEGDEYSMSIRREAPPPPPPDDDEPLPLV